MEKTKSGIEVIADKIIELIEKGEAPWQRPWDSNDSMLPENPTTGAAYRGMNRLWLSVQGRSDGRWMTLKQAGGKGWKVRKGEKGTPIVKFQNHEFKKQVANPSGEMVEAKENVMFAKTYYVFNAEQIDGIPQLDKNEAPEFGDVSRAEDMMEALVVRTGLTIRHGGDKAFYSPDRDTIQLPPKELFHSAYDWAATGLHELSHATLAESRLDRKNALGKFGTEAYAMEELRAEISSFFLAAETRIPQSEDHIKNHSAYCGSWIKALKDDKREILRACADAERIVGFILDNEKAYLSDKQAITVSPSVVAESAGMAAVLEHRKQLEGQKIAAKPPTPALRMSM